MTKGLYERTPEIREKMRQTRLGKSPWNKGKKGIQSPWNKGISWSDEVKEKISKTLAGRFIGENNPNWVGDNANYNVRHMWIYSRLGKPTSCENYEQCGGINLTGHQIHWANISGEYKRDISDWARLCQYCHFAFDNVGVKIWKTRKERGN